jgi:hypothetical protein
MKPSVRMHHGILSSMPRPKCEAINWQRKCAPQELSDTVLDHPLKQPHQQVHLHLRVQRRRKENVKLVGGGKGGDGAPAGSVTLGRLQFSWEKAKAVSARTPQTREMGHLVLRRLGTISPAPTAQINCTA